MSGEVDAEYVDIRSFLQIQISEHEIVTCC